MACDLWTEYKERRERQDLDTRQVTVKDWLVPLFEDVLGYHDMTPTGSVTVGERRFPIDFHAASGTVPLVLTTANHELDRAAAPFGDEGRRRPPHGLVQEYLNAAAGCLWGIVANGRQVRLLRNNPSLTRPAYIETDLERLFEEQLFADFAAFWLLFHSSRLTPRDGGPSHCQLEDWRTTSQETGERVLEKLRDGVTEALRQLGNGFLEHPANDALRQALQGGTLTAMEYFQELLRLIYRLLFLFTAEDRRLLFPSTAAEGACQLYIEGYALARLRERALKRRHYDGFTDLWTGLQVTLQGLSQGAPPLGLPALGGLFAADQCPTLDCCVIANRRLLSALRALAFFPTGQTLAQVNYRDMGTEELGSVYESLLELQPKVDATPWRFGFLGDEQEQGRGSQRKLTGSYYTPTALVGELIKSTLAPVVVRTIKNHPQAPREALLALNIVDPACGSGHFLLAAARYLAAELARLAAGPDTPSEVEHQQALRQVVQYCIYGVDRNPLAVELCKTALWIETVEPGKPLGFLDAHIRCGDSLVGVLDPAILEQGILDEAYQPLTGDDKAVCRELKKRNQHGKGGAIQGSLFDQASLQAATATAVDLDAMPEDTPADIEKKRQAWAQAEREAAHQRQFFKANLWVGAFFAPKTADYGLTVPLHEDLNRVNQDLVARPGLEQAVAELARAHRFFHWYLAFPEAFAQGGFDVVLGNPPWERIKLQEQEFFAARSPEIANARNKAERERLIQALNHPEALPVQRALYEAFQTARREAEAASLYVRHSGRFPLTAVGDVNTYALFAELFYRLRAHGGQAGIIVPSGIATDDSTKRFFDEITSQRQLVSLLDFENREAIFPGVHRSYKFCLLTLGHEVTATQFLFFATHTEQLADSHRHFTLSADEIQLINPNTRTCPVFRSGVDAELTRKIYRRVPVLIDETKSREGNPWGISFMRMLDMSNDSHLFKTAEQLAAEGAEREGANWLAADGEVWVPLYEAKMIHQYDHRWATYAAEGENSREVTAAEKGYEGFQVMPRYWVPQREVEDRLADKAWERQWLMGWRDICRSTDERTVIAGVIPRVGVGHTMPLFFLETLDFQLWACLYANWCSLVFDFIARQKIGGTHLTYSYLKQFPTLMPPAYNPPALGFIIPRVLELVYTAHDLKPFAEDLGYAGPPFKFDPNRRAVLRAELDACFAHLYGLTRDELRYILDPADVYGEDFPSETFRVLKKNERREFGEYRTRRLVLEAWDRFQD